MVDGLPDLGVVTPLGYGNAPGTLRDFAAAAERRGVNGIQVGELASTEVFSLVSAMAAVTSRIRLDTAVIATLTRSPALLAMGAATLAELSSGRFVLGLGAGSAGVDTVRLVPLTSLGGGIGAAYAIADIIGELSSRSPLAAGTASG